MRVARPRSAVLKSIIVSELNARGPMHRADLTAIAAQRFGIPRNCGCCPVIHDQYDDLIDDTVKALVQLEQDGKAKWDNHIGKWRAT